VAEPAATIAEAVQVEERVQPLQPGREDSLLIAPPSVEEQLLDVSPERLASIQAYVAGLVEAGWDGDRIARHVAQYVLRPQIEVAHEATAKTTPTERPKRPRKGGRRGSYLTWQRRRLLAAIAERPGIGTAEAALQAGMERERARRSLLALKDEGLVACARVARGGASWTIIPAGLAVVFEAASSTSGKFDMGSTKGLYGTSHVESAGGRLSLLLEARHRLYQRMRRLGFRDHVAHRALRTHRVDYLMRQTLEIERLREREQVRSPGKLLYFRLFAPDRDERRKAGLVKKVVPEGVRATYLQTTKNVSFPLARHLAYALRKLASKGLVVTPGDVTGILNALLKRDAKRRRPPLE